MRVHFWSPAPKRTEGATLPLSFFDTRLQIEPLAPQETKGLRRTRFRNRRINRKPGSQVLSPAPSRVAKKDPYPKKRYYLYNIVAHFLYVCGESPTFFLNAFEKLNSFEKHSFCDISLIERLVFSKSFFARPIFLLKTY